MSKSAEESMRNRYFLRVKFARFAFLVGTLGVKLGSFCIFIRDSCPVPRGPWGEVGEEGLVVKLGLFCIFLFIFRVLRIPPAIRLLRIWVSLRCGAKYNRFVPTIFLLRRINSVCDFGRD